MPEPRIWILPPEIAERIAAGEVVERPASAVKELVENALDAGARRIVVETQAGGKALIRITDDGCGMTPEEARLALQRHATSKLRSADDLFNIHTLGFRGEALPSIAAVSELEILTRTPDAPEGTRLSIEGGVVKAIETAAAPVGTTITVRRLFFNVPVREKFLKSDSTEAGQITDWLQRLALSHADVSFRLIHDGRESLLSPGSQDPLNAVVAVLGRQIARDMIRVGPAIAPPGRPGLESGEPGEGSPEEADPFEEGSPRPAQPGINVTGFIGRPTLTRANRALQHFYVNGRSVRSPLFFRALDDAFRATMPQGRYPVALLFIEVPPAMVDVNVHPAKTEVRFQDEGSVQAALRRAVREALSRDGELSGTAAQPPIPTPDQEELPPRSLRVCEPAAAPPASTGEETGALPFAQSAIGGRVPPTRWQTPSRAPGRESVTSDSPPIPNLEREPETARAPLPPDFDPFEDPSPARPAGFRTPAPAPAPAPAGPTRPAIAELALLGQVRDLFILAEGDGKLWVIDQHVAHERVLFDRMMDATGGAEPAEPILLPPTLEVDRTQALALEEHRELLAELGFGVEPFGPNQYRLVSVPRSLLGRNYEAVFRDLADELATQSHGGQVKLRKEEVASVAAGRSCKTAVKAGQTLGDAELEQLLRDLRGARNPYTCPHGRPVFLTFAPEEVAALFGSGPSCG